MILKRARRKACKQLITRLFRYNEQDDCWDPVGSIDRAGLICFVERIASGKEEMPAENKRLWRRRKK